jgi:translation initiation factor IF-2
VGEITESDIELAAHSKGIVVGFNSKRTEALTTIAKNKGVEIRSYKIIYDMVDDIKSMMESKLTPLLEKISNGRAEVKAVFGGGNQGKVAGCVVLDGQIAIGNTCILRRKGKPIHEANLKSLRRSKDKVEVVEVGHECGIDVEGFKDWEVGDYIECYRIVSRQRTIEES